MCTQWVRRQLEKSAVLRRMGATENQSVIFFQRVNNISYRFRKRRDCHHIKLVSRLSCNFKTSHTLDALTSRPLFETTSTPIQVIRFGAVGDGMVQHPIGFTAADIFQVRSDGLGHRRTRVFLNASLVFVSFRHFNQ